jgi:F-type H+-transporting ATPase subunit beta
MSSTGKVSQVIGSVLDAKFPEGKMPEIYNALELQVQGQKLVCEVQQHLGGGAVRAVALGSTDGVARGQDIIDTGAPISIPVGLKSLGRIFNVLGEPVDEAGPVQVDERRPDSPRGPRF